MKLNACKKRWIAAFAAALVSLGFAGGSSPRSAQLSRLPAPRPGISGLAMISAAQRPYAGWERETRAFAHVGADRPPSWGDFADPLDAIAARFRERRAEGRAGEREDGKPLSEADRRALEVLGLGVNSDRTALRRRYAELARRYHPDRNGGDRTQEARLQAVIAAYQQLRRAPAFA